MQMNHRIPVKTVIRSRFRSTTDDDPRDDETPPPKRSDSPPPLPLCSSTSTTMSRLVMIRTIKIAMVTAGSGPLRAFRSGDGAQITIPADPDKFPGIEAGPSHQAPIDVRLRHDRGHVVWLHRPAIQNTRTSRHSVPVNGGNAAANGGADFLSVLRRRYLAGADRPDRLVGHDHATDLFALETGEAAVQLGEGIRDVVAGLAYLERLADAQHGGDGGPQSGLHLGVNQRVVLAVVLSPLRVTGQYVVAAQLGQHRPRHITRVRAIVVRRDVLRAVQQPELVALDERLHAAQRGERRQHGHVDGVEILAGQAERQLLGQRNGLEMVVVHLPVAGDERFPATRLAHVGVPSSSATSPGSHLPSRYSRLAPPPVEMWVNESSGIPRIRTAAP